MEETGLFDSLSLSSFKNELKPFCYKNGKTIRSYQQFFKLYYYIRLLKYVTIPQLKYIGFSGVEKVATKKLMSSLVELGHISVVGENKDVFIANEKTDIIVKGAKYSSGFIKLFANLPRGKDTHNEIKNTSVFVDAIRLTNYHHLLFPHFEYLIPDALLVLKEDKYFKLVFIEVETKQSNWEARLERMRENYLKLSSDIEVYEYWKTVAGKLSLPIPELTDFKFSVKIIGSINNKNWGKGFEFRERIS